MVTGERHIEIRRPQHSPVCSFFTRFFSWFILLQFLVWCLKSSFQLKQPLLVAITWLAARLSSAAGNLIAQTENLLIHLDNGSYLRIDFSCSGIQMSATLIAGLLAFRCRKLSYYFLVVAGIQLLNQLRIVHLFQLIHYDFQRFTFYHLYVWQMINFLVAALIFAVLLYRVARNVSC